MGGSGNSGAECDLLIRGGLVVDGTGSPGRMADILVTGERISGIMEAGGSGQVAARTVVEAEGMVVAPGFIDVHTHDDNAVLVHPKMTAKISQGVTTVIVGNCGISLSPIANIEPVAPLNLLGDRAAYRFSSMKAYLDAVRQSGTRVNVGALVGHTTLRLQVMADLTRAATPEEAQAMRALLAQSLKEGAIGFSSGLYYKPAGAADEAEMVTIAEALKGHGGTYTTHMRDEHGGVMQSLFETMSTAGKAGVPVVISHHKCAGPANWGRTRETLPFIEAARLHQRVGLDAYPYAAGSTVLDPDWVDESIRTMITSSAAYPEMTGRDLSGIAAEWGCSQRDAAARLAPAGAVYFQMDEEDVRRVLSFAPTMIGSDGLPRDSHPHPRLWGTFPRVLGHYCRELGLFSLETAIHKMSGLSAATFGLKDRGFIKEGGFADLVLFDADRIEDVATYADPARPSVGIGHVFVNGALAYLDGIVSDRGAGQVVQLA